jgi:thiol-disulfide isomerase/thioredoxin
MSKLLKYRLLFFGILSPLAAVFLYALVYTTLTRLSSDLERDWSFRLALSALAMVVPFLFVLALTVRDKRRHSLSLSGKIGFALAILSLGLVWKPVNDGLTRWKQSHNQAMQNIAAPLFDTVDLNGKTQRLADQKGKVVLVNIWATWCGPCRAEMPQLDRLYRERKDQGFIAFGLSDEDVGLQKKFLQQVPVTYPLLTQSGRVPALYRDIARYPAVFLIDRQGQLQPAPGPEQPFEKLEAAVNGLLKKGPS